MEGLIPMVYKSLKKNKKRRNYECLSFGAAQTYDFYTKHEHDDDDDEYPRHDLMIGRKQQHLMIMPEADGVRVMHEAHHRRFNSVDAGRPRSLGSENNQDVYKPKQLVRFRSHRMFSCVTDDA